MKNEKLDHVIFYAIEKAIKTYRQFAQAKLKTARLNITVDQWLTLKILYDNPGISQKQLADLVFKDSASITRIIDLLVKQSYLARKSHNNDKRRSTLDITGQGKKLLKQAYPVVKEYRRAALRSIKEKELERTRKCMHTIIVNCS
jgi:MarR family transcriptional regulator, transcriptional regulator for hemolysin